MGSGARNTLGRDSSTYGWSARPTRTASPVPLRVAVSLLQPNADTRPLGPHHGRGGLSMLSQGVPRSIAALGPAGGGPEGAHRLVIKRILAAVQSGRWHPGLVHLSGEFPFTESFARTCQRYQWRRNQLATEWAKWCDSAPATASNPA